MTGSVLADADSTPDKAKVRNIADAKRKRRAADPPGNDDRPEVIVRKGRIHETADQAEAALIASGLPFYARGDVLVRLATGVKTPGVRRDAALPVLVPVTGPSMQEGFEQAARFVSLVKQRDGKFEPRVVGCPSALPAVYLARVSRWQLPSVRAVSSVPLVLEDGSILREGYDPASEAVVCGNLELPPIPPEPTKDQAMAAVLHLNALLHGFPFTDEVSRAVAFACLLSAVLRPVLPTCPAFGFTAPVRGSGKSKLADIASMLATGRAGAAVTWPAREEEAEKRLDAVLLAGDAVVVLDNLEVPLRSAALNSALTQDSIALRVLGFSRMARVPVASLILATGNNLTIQGDLSRRFLLCELDPQMERPELREFKFDPVQRARERRAELVAALLTIAQWGAREAPGGRPLGSFETWSRRVRDPLVALGFADPVACMEQLHESDPEREQALALLARWREAFEARPVTVAEAIRRATDGMGPDSDLRDALDSVCGGPGGLNAKRLGRYLLRMKDRQLGRFKVRKGIDHEANVATWTVEARA
jgi:putative DNA primase/helicase